MKRSILFVSLFISGLSFSQQFDQTNEPNVGDFTDYFLCDSFAVNYDGITGSGVTWDYSAIEGVTGITKTVSFIDPATTTFASNFPTSTKASSIGNSITTYFNSDVNSRNSQGFVFNEPTFGDVVAAWETDEEKTHAYPMDLYDEVTDYFEGTMYYEFSGFPQSSVCTGYSYAWADGLGTLITPGGSYNNVLRYKLIDSAFATVVLVGDIELIRTQYEYYDFTVSNLPIFSHITIKLQSPGATNPLGKETLVLSKDEPNNWLGLESKQITEVRLFPNPANESFVIDGIKDPSSLTLVDQSGRTVKSFDSISNGEKIDVSEIKSGIYTVMISGNSATSVQRLVIK